MKRTRLTLLCALLVSLNACSIFGDKDNAETPAKLEDFTPATTVSEIWSANVGSGADERYLKLQPAVYNNQVFAASPKGYVSAFDLKTGQNHWEKRLDVVISGGVGTNLDSVFVASNKGDVIALAMADGTEKWRVQLNSEVLSTPQADDSHVIVRTIDGKVYNLNTQNGATLWVQERTVPTLSLRGNSNPILLAQAVLVGFDNGHFAALDVNTGKPLWESAVAMPQGRSELERMVDIDADPKLINDTIYVVSYQGRSAAINLYNGQLVWQREVPSYAGIGVDDKAVYVSDQRSHVWALDRHTGASLWKQEKLQARALTAPVSMGEYVIVGDLEGYLHYLRRDDGQFVARYKTGSARILTSPIVIDKQLIVYTSGGELLLLENK
ncbi:outer membrane protein assembly factor BamB [Beggiatoa leptomitoformis]|uniref:Outer membrane protein assembly factor BamB n=1 Tax=Beggiatoa leptomitoformis TaxID=288004 RepID=A0A2N9YHQ2_9GAMM|nr:outer membrane protein assembly factor BamB [Beggiatoa leptomitoformis]ALG67683.1 outer membrane protein assembly factor BamB [Beggiatoa leptomitoformis]AUI70081.1 outer membrane protein assembly factor BamB [Beggiatoa leptomitoformis]